MSNSYCNAGRRFGNWFLSGKVTKGRDANFTLSSLHENNIDVPQTGVIARTSDNELFDRMIGTSRKIDLPEGLRKLYTWIDYRVNAFKY